MDWLILRNDRVAINRGADIRVRSYTPSESRVPSASANGDRPLKSEISSGKGEDRRWHYLSADPDTVARSVFPDNDILTIHRDRIPKSRIVFYEFYEPREDDAMQNAQGSARLLCGRSIRSKLTPEEFAFEHGFNHLKTAAGDNIAINPSLADTFTLEEVDPQSIAREPTATKNANPVSPGKGPPGKRAVASSSSPPATRPPHPSSSGSRKLHAAWLRRRKDRRTLPAARRADPPPKNPEPAHALMMYSSVRFLEQINQQRRLGAPSPKRRWTGSREPSPARARGLGPPGVDP